MNRDGPFYESIVGSWCAYSPIGSYGMIATEEILFTEDGRFHWQSLMIEGRELTMEHVKGNWRIEDETIYFEFTYTDAPEITPNKRRVMRITDRQGRLGLKTIQLDDEPEITTGDGYGIFLQPAEPGDGVRSHEEAMQRLKKPVSLDPPFHLLKTLLTMAIPVAVKKLALPEPVFCIRLYYYSSLAPREDYGTSVRILTEPLRQRVVNEQESHNVADTLWHPTAGEANGEPGKDAGLYEVNLSDNKDLARLFAEVYDLLADDEEETMTKLRAMLRLVSKDLNARDWSKIAATTDDFVVFPADGSNYFAGEYEDDMLTAASMERMDLLRERGLV